MATTLQQQVEDLARAAREASFETARLSRATKDRWILRAAERLEAARERILAANREDVREAEARGVDAALANRLVLEGDKWTSMIAGLRDVAALPDPIGEISQMVVRPSGLRVGRMRIPLGVIAIVYESRPNVTVDAAALCVKSGNAVILRGGSEAIRSNLALGEELRAAATETGVPADAIAVVPTDGSRRGRSPADARPLDRPADPARRSVADPQGLRELAHPGHQARRRRLPHLPRRVGGSRDGARDRARLEDPADGGVQRRRDAARPRGRRAHDAALRARRAGGRRASRSAADARTQELFPQAKPATEDDWYAEYLAPILAVRVVDDLDAAIAHIRHYGSNHTEVIVTSDYANSQAFVRRVDSSCVGVNCSTAFADGYRLGLGAEIGISTSKLHAYGPMGLEGLTTQKFVLFGDGQLRPD